MALDERERTAWLIAMGEARGGVFDFDSMTWLEKATT